MPTEPARISINLGVDIQKNKFLQYQPNVSVNYSKNVFGN